MSAPPDGFRIGPIDDPLAALAVARACDERDAGVADTELRHLTDDLDDPATDVALDSWLARDADGRVAGFATLVGPRPAEVQRSWVRVHPAFRGRGLGASLLDLVVG
ncbi:MAG: GNAT family N-acetyltransferase, partial [Actinomycetota bacterium]